MKISPKIQEFIKKHGLLEHHPYSDNPLKQGDLVSFIGGYHDNIPMAFNIIGFELDEESQHVAIYVDWECYWFPIYEETRRVTLVSDRLEAMAVSLEAKMLKN